MSEHTYCDRCGMEITGERHRMGEGAIGPIPWFHHKFDLCGGCFKDWKNWLPRSTRPEPDLDAPVQVEQGEWVEWKVDKFDYRAKPDGSVVQWRTGTSWTDVNEFEQADYRKGREVAQAEMQERLSKNAEVWAGEVRDIQDQYDELHEQVGALVEAIGKPYSVRFTADVRQKPGSVECMYYQIEPTGMVRVDGVGELVEWAESVQEAAKAVQL